MKWFKPTSAQVTWERSRWPLGVLVFTTLIASSLGVDTWVTMLNLVLIAAYAGLAYSRARRERKPST